MCALQLPLPLLLQLLQAAVAIPLQRNDAMICYATFESAPAASLLEAWARGDTDDGSHSPSSGRDHWPSAYTRPSQDQHIVRSPWLPLFWLQEQHIELFSFLKSALLLRAAVFLQRPDIIQVHGLHVLCMCSSDVIVRGLVLQRGRASPVLTLEPAPYWR